MEKLKDELNRWQEKVARKGIFEKREEFFNDIRMEIKPLYTPLDLRETESFYLNDLGFPGEYPFTRGISSAMYRAQSPNIRVYVGYGTPTDTNDRIKKVLRWGADEIQIAVDLPTQVGYDSDHIMATAEVGRVGVAIDSLKDMEELFRGVPLNSMRRVSMLGNSFGPVALALFIALGEKQGLDPSEYVVDLQNDVLKEYVARGTQIFPIEPAMRLSCDVVEYCAKNNLNHWYPLTVCVNHMNAAGAGSSLGSAFALSNARCYIEELLKRGLGIDEFGQLIHMFLDERDDFFVAIANMRAVRRLWAEIMRERYMAQNHATMALKVTAYAHGRETLMEPINNIVRIAFASLAYYFGGVQFLYNASYDEAISTPSEESVKVAIRTQQIIFEEMGFSSTVDPLGGSYYLEKLTSDIFRDVKQELDNIERLGGNLVAIDNGYFRQHITDGAIKRQREFDKKQRISVGVNKFASDEPIPQATFRIGGDVEKRQKQSLALLKESRDNERVKHALGDIAKAAKKQENMVPTVLEAVRAYATVGEICNVLREVYGEFESRGEF